MTKILSFYLFIALLALLAVVLVAAEAEVDPVIQKRLEEAASKEERERKHREGVARAQKVTSPCLLSFPHFLSFHCCFIALLFIIYSLIFLFGRLIDFPSLDFRNVLSRYH